MITITTKVAGTMKVRMEALKKRYAEAAEKSVIEVAEKLLEISKADVPVESGALKASGRVLYDGSGFDTWASAGYGGKDFKPVYLKTTKSGKDVYRYPFKYAKAVHWRVDNVNHPKGKARFLIDAKDNNKREFVAIFRKNFRGKRP